MTAKLPGSKWIRWKGVFAIGALLVFGGIYSLLFFDDQVKYAIEKLATDLNGSEVNIADLETSWLGCKLELSGIQVSNHMNPLKNLVEFDKIALTFYFAPLLRKKLIIDNIQIIGVRYGTNRRNSGFVEPEDTEGLQAPSLIDRVASGLYAGVRTELNDNPLKFIGQLSTGLNLKGKLDAVRKNYASEKSIAESWTKLNSLSQEWERAIWDLPTKEYLADSHKKIEQAYNSRNSSERAKMVEAATTVKSDLEKLEAAASTKLTRIEEQADSLMGTMKNLDPLVKQDVQTARRVLGLPRTDFDDLTPQVFGPRLLGYLERLSYWIDLSRRKMPKGTIAGPVTWVSHPSARGQDIQFGKLAGSPMFLIKTLTIDSDQASGTGAGKVKGRLVGITSDPAIYGHPTEGIIEADFPNSGVRNLTLKFKIDHTKSRSSEDVSLNVEGLPLENWVFANTGELAMKVKHGVATGELKSSFNEDELKASWKFSLRDVDYEVVSVYKQAEEMIRNIINPIYSVDLVGYVEGPFDKPQFVLTSALGKRLAEGLKQEYRHQLAAIDDNLTKIILDQIDPKKMEFTYRFGEIRQKFIQPMEEKVRQIQSLRSLASQTVARLDPKSVRRGIASPKK